MALHTQLLQSCVEEAAAASQAALARAIDDALAALQIAETQSRKPAERDAIAAACLGLTKHRPSWLARYPADLLVAFQSGLTSTLGAALQPDMLASVLPDGAARQSGSGRHDSARGLGLVDDAEVSQSIEASRLLQLVLPAVELPLAELDRLISSAQGLGNVRPELNPLRPEMFTVTLRLLVAASSPDGAMASLWLRNLAAPLGREIRLIYEKIVNRLELGQVRGASYRVVQTPVGVTRRSAGSPDDRAGRNGRADSNGGTTKAAKRTGTGSGREPVGYVSDEPLLPSRYTDLSDHGVQNALMNDFLRGGAHDAASHGLAPAYYDDIEEELRALKRERDPAPTPVAEPAPEAPTADYADLPAVDRPQRVVNELSQLSEKIWGVFGRRKARAQVRVELKKDARRVGQVLGLEAVRQLVNQVAQDERLLAPVREAIVALQPSLLRLAMVDPRFFRDEAHAGRRLIERVAQRSFNYNDEFSTEFAGFFEPVAAAFNRLNSSTAADPQAFEQALALLQQAWDSQDKDETSRRQAVLQALRFAEERQLLADGIAFELSRRSDLAEVPGLVLDFLFGPWALAMAHARLIDTRSQIDPQGFGMLVPELLWSVKRSMTLKQPSKLIELIPVLLAQLHAGLALLGTDASQTRPFFDGLMQLHQPVLNLRRKKSMRDAGESAGATLATDDPAAGLADETPATPEQRLAKAAAQPWLARGDLEAAGFDETVQGDIPTLHAPNTSAPDAAPVDAPQSEDSTDSGQGPASELASPPTYEGQPPAGQPTAARVGRTRIEPFSDAVPRDADPEPNDTGHTGAIDSPAANGLAGDITPAEAELALRGLQPGMWVDLYARQRWRRAQLVWSSGKGTLFMFVSHGGQAHSMTRRSCERLIAARLLRPVPTHGVVAQALDAVALETAALLTQPNPAASLSGDRQQQTAPPSPAP